MSIQDSLDVVAEVQAERIRQREVEGWTDMHDDSHHQGEMAQAAMCYADPSPPMMSRAEREEECIDGPCPKKWPHYSWSAEWWKPKGRRRNLIRAAALLIAEIERIDRRAKRR